MKYIALSILENDQLMLVECIDSWMNCIEVRPGVTYFILEWLCSCEGLGVKGHIQLISFWHIATSLIYNIKGDSSEVCGVERDKSNQHTVCNDAVYCTQKFHSPFLHSCPLITVSDKGTKQIGSRLSLRTITVCVLPISLSIAYSLIYSHCIAITFLPCHTIN